MFVKSRSD